MDQKIKKILKQIHNKHTKTRLFLLITRAHQTYKGSPKYMSKVAPHGTG